MAQTGSPSDRQANRPLSPHLQVYRLTFTFLMSGFHRVTGSLLYFGIVIFVWWLVAAASGPAYFDFVNSLFGSWFGRLVLLGMTWLTIHHALGGVRHFIWDTGRGLGERERELLARA
ncbi:MAG: succinate dehydrogenase, cytochrome b556 subunit, partial [Hyphomicrobiales bacterium]|nr:succinate dehydrogenase, cytochrome b556 subunit [Hyphomicrobiales bacterium]